MSKSRISFPFSFLLSSSRSGPSVSRPHQASSRYLPITSPTSRPRANFTTHRFNRRTVETAGQRYGTAIEPPPHLSGNKSPSNNSAASTSTPNVPEKAPTKALATGTTQTTEAEQQGTASEPANSEQQDLEQQAEQELDAFEQAATLQAAPSSDQGNTAASQTSNTQAEPNNLGNSDESALKMLLGMDSQLSAERAEKPPHLEPPPYIHHFDTYTLVRSLEEGGFSEREAVLVMKAVRGILADNMNLARDGLVSKGDAEMTAYLFRSACSELRTEMRNNRASTNERMQSERNMLQHEVDVLSQRITAETSSLKDELKGMFDDRKMDVRMERRDLENQIQEINYTITTQLNSEMKSESEGLRWVLVRRTAISIAIVTATALITLKIIQTAEKRKEEAAAAARDAADRDRSTEYSGSTSLG